MELNKEKTSNAWVVYPEEKIDNDNAMGFQDALEEIIEKDTSADVLIDLGKVNFVSSAGLRVFLIIAKTLQKDHRNFGLCGLNDLIQEIFQVSGFDQIITIYPSRDNVDFLGSGA